jgi:hypothetical protein
MLLNQVVMGKVVKLYNDDQSLTRVRHILRSALGLLPFSRSHRMDMIRLWENPATF